MKEVIKGDIFLTDKIGDYLDEGYYGIAYRYDTDKVIKIQEFAGTANQYEVVSAIKNLHLPNFYRLFDVLYNEKCGLRTFKGTISQYYSEVDIDLWTERSEYSIESFLGLFDSVVTLGRNDILIDDLHLRNAILGSLGITIIDVDDYLKVDGAVGDSLVLENLRMLKTNFFCGLLTSHFLKSHAFTIERADLLKSIYELVNTSDVLDKDTFCKTLSKYKYPIDWLKNCR